ncbi:MAG: hypothetical protein ACOX4I_09405 [Anaerovoracaceae bacterium]
MYGRTTLPIKEEIVKKILGDEEQVTCRPADLIAPELEQAKEGLCRVHTAAGRRPYSGLSSPKVAQDFFKRRIEKAI